MKTQLQHLPVNTVSRTQALPSHAGAAQWSRWGLSFLLTAAVVFSWGTAMAEKPEGAGQGKAYKFDGQGKGGGHNKGSGQASSKGGANGGREAGIQARSSSINVSVGAYFQPQQRSVVQAYYGPILQSGKCPPGLAKKNNGCLPPGQAKAYTLGRPLAQQVVFYDVPSSVVVQLGVPPAGHRYVRVAADILLIAVGTGMVVDAIGDLGRL